ncbi:MAG: 5-formyltetrahydrofolate cyclo-ligase [Thomasclavelia sp.]
MTISAKSNLIISKLKKNSDFINAKTIGIYVSFKNEVNTISLIKEMLAIKKSVYLKPKII